MIIDIFKQSSVAIDDVNDVSNTRCKALITALKLTSYSHVIGIKMQYRKYTHNHSVHWVLH